MAVEHLLKTGCAKIAHLAGPLEVYASRERMLGFEFFCKENNCFSPSLISYSKDFHILDGFKAMKEILSSYPNLDGVFAGNDLMAIGALKALHQEKIKVPDQIQLIGFDNIILSENTFPGITTIKQPIYEMGALAMNLLLDCIRGDRINNKHYELNVELIERETTKQVY